MFERELDGGDFFLRAIGDVGDRAMGDLAVLPKCTAPGFLDTRLRYAAGRSSYASRASIGV